jgi:hypothetical protein
VKIGVGYNFTDFSDELTDLSFDHPRRVLEHDRARCSARWPERRSISRPRAAAADGSFPGEKLRVALLELAAHLLAIDDIGER